MKEIFVDVATGSVKTITATEQDNLNETYKIILKKNEARVDLTDKNVKMILINEKIKFSTVLDLPIIDAKSGELKLQITDKITFKSGILNCQLGILGENGFLENTGHLSIYVKESLFVKFTELITSKWNFGDINKIIEDAKKFGSEFPNWEAFLNQVKKNEDERIEAEKRRDKKIEDINSQCTKMADDYNKALANVTNGNESATNSEIVQARGKSFNLGARLDGIDSQLSDSLTGLKSFLWEDGLIKVAHRGFHLNAPENTILSIINAKNMGFDMVELDINKTQDNNLILMHDYTVDRTTNGTGKINDLTLAQAKDLIIDEYYSSKIYGEEIRIPTFEESCEALAKSGLLVNWDMSKISITLEIFDEIIRIIKKYGLYYKSLFIITDKTSRDLILNKYNDITIGWLNPSSDLSENLTEVKRYKNGFLCYRYTELNEEILNFYNDNNVKVYIYGADIQSIFQRWGNKVKFIETNNIIGGV